MEFWGVKPKCCTFSRSQTLKLKGHHLDTCSYKTEGCRALHDTIYCASKGMMEVRGCAKRDRPVKSDGCVRLRGQKIKGIEGLGASILLQCEMSRYFGKALHGPRPLSLQVNHGSLDKKSWNLCQFLFEKGFYLIFIFKFNYAVPSR